jgi:hypothetical protein
MRTRSPTVHGFSMGAMQVTCGNGPSSSQPDHVRYHSPPKPWNAVAPMDHRSPVLIMPRSV